MTEDLESSSTFSKIMLLIGDKIKTGKQRASFIVSCYRPGLLVHNVKLKKHIYCAIPNRSLEARLVTIEMIKLSFVTNAIFTYCQGIYFWLRE